MCLIKKKFTLSGDINLIYITIYITGDINLIIKIEYICLKHKTGEVKWFF